MSSCPQKLNIESLQQAWHMTMPDCGPTLRRAIYDEEYCLEWRCLYNFKRMQRRFLPKEQLAQCAFCLAAKSKDFRLGSCGTLSIYGNRYPVEPMHLLLFNDKHGVDPDLADLHSVIHVAKTNPQLKVLLSNRPGSGASIPAHMHIHAFLLDLPLEQAKSIDSLRIQDFTISQLKYPAWTVKITFANEQKAARFIHQLINSFEIPFNIDFIGQSIYIIPRKLLPPISCKNLVDGVGSLETAGIYTVVNEHALRKINLEIFRQGLGEASYTGDSDFQQKFINCCQSIICKL